MQKKLGKLIVIDGTDGSGKATQTNLLVRELRQKGYQVRIADFPQYGNKSAGLVEEYLNGKYGKANEVTPYQASIFYACDRFAASFKIKKWLKEGIIIISNRYASSNMAHQGGKIADPKKRKKFLSWLFELEYKIFNIPRPDLNIVLHVEAKIAQKLIDQKKFHGRNRDYIINGEKKDIHETNLKHLKNAEKIYLEIAKSFPRYTLVECVKNNKILAREKIHKLIWQKVKNNI